MIGAHLGVLSASCSKERFKSAIKHGRIALQYASGDVHAEIEALSLLAELHTQVERYDEARRICANALGRKPRAHKLPCLLRNLVYASLRLNDSDAAKKHFQSLQSSLTATPNPWEHASCEFVIGHAYAEWGDYENAKSHYEIAYRTAEKYKLGEIRWQTEKALLRVQARDDDRGSNDRLLPPALGSTWICADSHVVREGVTSIAVLS
jgi:tetratricopeptide (TPR) repeat protein